MRHYFQALAASKMNRIEMIGNSIVPQVAYQIFKPIDIFYKTNQTLTNK